MSVELPTLYQQQIHQSKYARWNEKEHRRETWEETVTRYVNFISEQAAKFDVEINGEREELKNAILNQEIMPSMRAFMTAGKAASRDNCAIYNCAYLTVSRTHAFDEAMYILMCGTGVGFSVERQYINQLPEVPDELYKSDTIIFVRDSKIGWASALRQLISLLYSGQIPKWDTSKVRPSGARLKTFGGQASGPGPLEDLFRYIINIFQNAKGRKLNSLECHGIMCKIGDIVVVGGVRRSAMISLSNPSDDRMRDAKTGQWSDDHPEYMLANNSAAWTEKPSMERFLDEWTALIKSKSGERGIFNRTAAQIKVESSGRRDSTHDFGTNPCGEIILRDRQFCNLSEAVIRSTDTVEDIERKVRLATIMGTIQSTFTDFRYLSKKWKDNCEEERLLGVSLTGIMDNAQFANREGAYDLGSILDHLRQVAIDTNAEWATKLNINPSAAITCVKPSGTVSQLVDSASGIHSRYSKYYIRRNRGNKTDPVAQLLFMSGVPTEDEIQHPDTTWVFSYPIKSPEKAVVTSDVSAINQLELWMTYSEHWCEHNPSATIHVKEDEWLEVGAFVYKHFDKMCGITFLPYSDHIYQQAPYEEVSQEEFEALEAQMPETINWDILREIEKEDTTDNVKDLACVGATCELV